MIRRTACVFLALLCASTAGATGLTPWRLGVLYSRADPASVRVAHDYAAARAIPVENLVGLDLPDVAVLSPGDFGRLRARALAALPSHVESLVLVWTRPFAVGCMSITTAFAAGYQDGFCTPGCSPTTENPLYDSDGWLPADTVGWWPAMLLPSADPALAHALIERGRAADGTAPAGTLYLVSTDDRKRNVRAAGYGNVEAALGRRLGVVIEPAPPLDGVSGAIGYFTGATRVAELRRIRFRPGALADHLTSSGGLLEGGSQMPALAWLAQGATASYGTVSEPCNLLAKFPDIGVLFTHYLRGDSALEAYWKSVRMPGQGLFIGEPLARPFGRGPR